MSGNIPTYTINLPIVSSADNKGFKGLLLLTALSDASTGLVDFCRYIYILYEYRI